MKFFIETIGCQMNVNDSDKITDCLLASGLEQTNDMSEADLVILNTCSVRFSAEHKAYSFLGRIGEEKNKNPNLIVGVVGCMAQYAHKEIKKRCKFVDFVLGAKEIDKFADVISKFINTEYAISAKRQPGIFQYVTIMRGCQNFCSYCIVPYVRGPEISIDVNELLNEITGYAQQGVKEIILLGQNVNSYNYHGTNLTELSQKVSKIDGIKRIRFMTNHPKDFSDDLIDEIAVNDKICKHIHLPLQSASDAVLSRMNRKYTYGNYKLLIGKIRSKIPQINITSDIIIGFPGETDKDFQDTLQASKDLKFGGLFIFKYSPRPNTKAYKFQDNVLLGTKKERHSILLDQSMDISKKLNEHYINRTEEVLVDGYVDGVCESRNSQNIKIFFNSDNNLTGQIVNVKINKAFANSMFGDICEY